MHRNKCIAVDVDGTLCELKRGDESYIDLLPIKGAVEALQEFDRRGYEILLYTARGMGTYGHDVGKVTAFRIPELERWLKKWKIPYHGIYLKPDVLTLIDDRAIRFKSWKQAKKDIEKEIYKTNCGY